MQRNVTMLIGVNGAGKSTIATRLVQVIPDSIVLSGYNILKGVLGGVSRETLEKLSPGEKMSLMEPAFVEAFEKNSTSTVIVLDTHLVVPIRKGGTLVLENVWSTRYSPYIDRVYFILSSPDEILRRRLADQELIGRKRDISLENIERDQRLNLAVFEEIIVSNFKTAIVENPNGQIGQAVNKIAMDILFNSGTASVTSVEV